MDAMYWQPDQWTMPRLLLLGGTNGERRRARLDEHGGLYFRPLDPTGVKIMDVSVRTPDGLGKMRTPYGLRTVRRRRRANKIAKQARKVNR